jgi:hypothetical protein
LEVAKEAFTRSGANTSLDHIANTPMWDRELCIATFQRAMNF